jgi:CRP/FNR family transcriptional regulator
MNSSCNCAHCHNELCIHKVPIFSSLSKDDLYKITDLISHKEYKKGEILLREGEKTDAIIIINEGNVKAFKYNIDGREQILYMFSEGDFFGEQNLLSERTAGYFVEALTSVKVCSLSKDKFQKLIIEHPGIAVKIIAGLGERMARLENAMQGMGVRNIDSRIAAILLEFASKYGSTEKDGIIIQLPLSREGIANYLGVARETVSRKFGQLEDDGVIRTITNKTLQILIPQTLEELAGTK